VKNTGGFRNFLIQRGLALLLVLAALAASLSLTTRASAVEVPSQGQATKLKSVREDIHLLQGSEKESGLALDRLQTRPRADVLAVVKDDLTSSSEIPPGTLKAVVALKAIELLPELKVLCAKTEDWAVFASVTRLVSEDEKRSQQLDRSNVDALAGLYLARLKSLLSATAKVAVLDGLSRFGRALPHDTFTALLSDSNLEVRIATVREFLATRSGLDPQERLARWGETLKLKPYQARLLAMEELARAPASEASALKGALKLESCAHESESEVKAACQAAAKSVKRGGKS
jgi:hypothetical protein